MFFGLFSFAHFLLALHGTKQAMSPPLLRKSSWRFSGSPDLPSHRCSQWPDGKMHPLRQWPSAILCIPIRHLQQITLGNWCTLKASPCASSSCTIWRSSRLRGSCRVPSMKRTMWKSCKSRKLTTLHWNQHDHSESLTWPWRHDKLGMGFKGVTNKSGWAILQDCTDDVHHRNQMLTT